MVKIYTNIITTAESVVNIKSTGIYIILCVKNNKAYIGSTKGNKSNFHKRWKNHLLKLEKNAHYNIKLQRAYNKYGVNNFIFDILELIPNENSYEFLWERELYYINKYNSVKKGFNISTNMKHPITFKRKVRKETCEKIRQGLLGKNRPESLKRKLGRPVYKLDFEENIVEEYYSLQNAAIKNNVWRQNIRHVCNGRDVTCGGYKWQYKDVFDKSK